jgi:hypothetical protein
MKSLGGELFVGSNKFCFKLYSPFGLSKSLKSEDKFLRIGIIILLSLMMALILYIINKENN